MSEYAWVIDKSYIEDDVPIERMGVQKSEGFEEVAGPHDATPEQLADARKIGTPFAIYDDDGVLYYRGKFVGYDTSPRDGYTSEWAFGPLDDFGAPNAGAVTIKYRRPDGHYDTL